MQDNGYFERLRQFAREDWQRLGEEETWNELLLSLGVVLTVFLILFALMEFGMQLHRGTPTRLGLAAAVPQEAELLDLHLDRVARFEEELGLAV